VRAIILQGFLSRADRPDIAAQQQHQGDVDMAEALMSTGQGAAAAAAAAAGSGTTAGAGSTWALAGAAEEHGSAVVEDARTAAAGAAHAAADGGVQQQFARPTGALTLPPGSAGCGTAAAVGSGSAALVGRPTVNVSAERASAAWVCENLQCTWRAILTQSFSAHGHSAKGS